jgi:hypothetical protein
MRRIASRKREPGVAIADIDVLEPSVEEHDDDEYEDWLDDVLFGDDDSPIGVIRWKQVKTEIPYADGGFGDGTYTVYQLMCDKKAVGLEVEFISADAKYGVISSEAGLSEELQAKRAVRQPDDDRLNSWLKKYSS